MTVSRSGQCPTSYVGRSLGVSSATGSKTAAVLKVLNGIVTFTRLRTAPESTFAGCFMPSGQKRTWHESPCAFQELVLHLAQPCMARRSVMHRLPERTLHIPPLAVLHQHSTVHQQRTCKPHSCAEGINSPASSSPPGTQLHDFVLSAIRWLSKTCLHRHQFIAALAELVRWCRGLLETAIHLEGV